MRLLADEGVDAPTVARLRADGHDVTYVAELAPGITDEAVLDLANAELRVLLIADKDFGDLVVRMRRVTAGVLLLRLTGLGTEARAEMVCEAVATYGARLTGAFAVVSPGVVRIRSRGRP